MGGARAMGRAFAIGGESSERRSNLMAKQPKASAADVSFVTPEYLLENRKQLQAEREAQGWNRQVPVSDEEIVYSNDEEQSAVELPEFMMDPRHVRGGFVGTQIVALSEIGGSQMRAAPLTARAVMATKGGKVPGAEDGDIAIYTTDVKSVQCESPIVIPQSEWVKMWSCDGEFKVQHHVQDVNWSAPRSDQPQPVRQGARRYFGKTAIADINVTDRGGEPINLGPHRFFFSNGEYFSLVAPLSPTHVAHVVQQFLYPGMALPPNPTARMLVAGMVQYRITKRLPRPRLIAGSAYLNLPSVKWEDLKRLLFDDSLSGKAIVSNHLALRASVQAANAVLRATQTSSAGTSEIAPTYEDTSFSTEEMPSEVEDESLI